MLASMEQMPSFKRAKKVLCEIAGLLSRKISIPQVKEKLDFIQEIQTDEFWKVNDVLQFERVRQKLRELMRFLDQDQGGRTITTHLTDSIIDQQEGVQLDAAYDFEDYREKVNRYIGEHGNTLAIHKLTHNIDVYKRQNQLLSCSIDCRNQ